MKMVAIEDLRMTADNTAAAKAVFELGNTQYRADLKVYLQGNDCLAVRLGRHDKGVESRELEDYLFAHKMEIRQQIKPEVAGLRQAYKQAASSSVELDWSSNKAS